MLRLLTIALPSYSFHIFSPLTVTCSKLSVILRTLYRGGQGSRPVQQYGICVGKPCVETGFSSSSSLFPVSIPLGLHAYKSPRGWAIATLVSAVQRPSVTPTTWTTIGIWNWYDCVPLWFIMTFVSFDPSYIVALHTAWNTHKNLKHAIEKNYK
jgi:hypothetical protein